MFPFWRKKRTSKRGPRLLIDLHSHLIPGIDDGARNMEESLLLVKGLEKLGYQKLITTPHIMSDAYRNGAENIGAGLEALKKALKEEGIAVTVEAAAEYYLDEKFFEEMQRPEVMSIGDKYILFESSYFSKPLQMEEMIFAIGKAGYQPLLAHPERYRYIRDPEKEYRRLKDLGVRFQVNLNSFGGHYGRRARELALFLSEAGMIDYLGSDTHHKMQVESLGKIFYMDVYHQIFRKNHIRNNEL